METFFNLLEVLGCTPKEFFNEETMIQKVVYKEEEQTFFMDENRGYEIQWLVPESNEKEMEPVILRLQGNGEFKEYEPSTFRDICLCNGGGHCCPIGFKNLFCQKR